MPNSKLIEAKQLFDIERPSGELIQLYTEGNARLIELTRYLRELAQKKGLIPQGEPTWQAYEKLIPAEGESPAEIQKTAIVVYRANSQTGVEIRAALKARLQTEQADPNNSYEGLSIEISIFGYFNPNQGSEDQYSAIAVYEEHGLDSNPRNASFTFIGQTGLEGARVDAKCTPKNTTIELFLRQKERSEYIDLVANGKVNKANRALARQRVPGLDVEQMARSFNGYNAHKIMAKLIRNEINATTPEEFWKKFSVELVK